MKRKLADRDTSSAARTLVTVKEEDTGPEIHHQDGKKRGSASRTGTACDRCRVRKMRCDDNPGGCASCRQAQTECKTTDRITGKATGRGYVDSLESRLSELEQKNQELRAQVLSLGGQVIDDAKDIDPALQPYNQLRDGSPPDEQPTPPSRSNRRPEPKSLGARKWAGMIDGVTDGRSPLPPSRKGLYGNNYFGISSGNSFLSSVRGTSMNVLGMEIDLADYLSPDVDEPDLSQGDQPVYNKSYRAFVQTAFGMRPRLAQVELPARSEGLRYAEIFLRITMPFVPVIHKPTYLSLLTRAYDDPHFKPSVAEIVTIHAAFAIAYHQFACRGSTNPGHQRELNTASNFHYHYALGFFPQLMASHTLADVQALALLCIHLRNCPKPGASWMLTSIVLDLAIELGLHRSAKNWPPFVKVTMLEVEMRKRVFWSIKWLHVLIGGSLGRPMALQAGDWDVEVPQAVDDDLLSESGLDKSRKGQCKFLAAIENFKILPIYLDLYNIIYGIGATPPNHEDTVRGLEKRLEEWHEQWPSELYDDAAFQDERGRIQLQYLHIWRLQCRLLLRHPSLSPTTSAQFNAESLNICLETSKELLSHVKMLQTNRGLDITWQTTALFVLAIATTLYGCWERKASLTFKEFGSLKQDMQDWLSIISDMDTLLHANGRLLGKVQTIVDTTLTSLSEHMISKAAPPPHKPQRSSFQNQSPTQRHPSSMSSDYPSFSQYSHVNNEHQTKPPDSYMSPTGSMPPGHMNAYSHRPTPYHRHQNLPPDYNTSMQPQNSLSTTAAAATAYMSSYSQSPYQNNFAPPTATDMYQTPGSSTSWRNFTGNVMPNLASNPHEYMSSASALTQMGNPPCNISIPDVAQRQSNVYGDGQMWPMSLFEPDPNGT